MLATDRLRQSIVHGLDTSRDREDFLLEGHKPSAETEARWGLHGHAHWLWTEDRGRLLDLALWVPAGLAPAPARRAASVVALPRWEQEPPGYRGGELHLLAAGPAERVLDDLGAGQASASWVSDTPLLTTWHVKPDDIAATIARYLGKELVHHFGDDAPAVEELQLEEENGYFTRRWDQRFRSHPAFHVHRLRLSHAVWGPLCLGALSHFGFGRLVPS